MSGSTSKRYPVELRERAVRMVAEIRADYESDWAAMTKVAELLGVGTPVTIRKWCRRAEVDAWPDRTPRLRRAIHGRSLLLSGSMLLGSSPRPGLSARRTQRPGRVSDRAVQDRAGQAAAAVKGARRPGNRHRRMGRLVQPPPAVRVLRRPHTSRGREGSLPSPPDPNARWSLKREGLRKPGAVQLDYPGCIFCRLKSRFANASVGLAVWRSPKRCVGTCRYVGTSSTTSSTKPPAGRWTTAHRTRSRGHASTSRKCTG